ncbi:MAG TPA: archease [Candidatus Nanoarchaeia archaeon]|nr:archease [Candidatus Nanoarchaeia archaeon]
MKYQFIEHTADVEFEAHGKSLEEVFSNCVDAFVKSISNEKILKKEIKTFEVEGNDLENLLYNFLEEFLILFDSENFILSKILKIEIDEKNFKLKCEFSGDDAKNYEIVSHVKAVTYNSMFVKKEKDKWTAHVVLDV